MISAQTAVEADLCDGGQRGDDRHDAVFGKVSTTALVRSVRAELAAIGRADIAAQTGGRSFRRGAASTLSAMGADNADIAALGWAHNSTATVLPNTWRSLSHREVALDSSFTVANNLSNSLVSSQQR